MYLAYLDESIDKECGLAMVGALLIQDDQFFVVEDYVGMVIENLVPINKLEKFEEFHAWELFGGHGVFEGIDEKERFEAIEALLAAVQSFEMPFVYSAVDTRALSNSAFGGANPIDVAFRMCARGIERKIAPGGDGALGLLIMDETKEAALKNQLKRSFNSERGKSAPPSRNPRRMFHMHDDMYFGHSRDSIGIQISDLCNYFVARKLKIRGDSERFYNIFAQRVFCAKMEPEWSQFRESFMEIGVQVAQ
jgi:hypothetical protein